MLARSPIVALIITIAGVALALCAQSLLAANAYSLIAWPLYAMAAIVAAVATWTRPSADVPPARVDVGSEMRPLWRWVWAAAAVSAVLTATALSAADRLPVQALGLWMVGMLLGPLAVRRWIATPPERAHVPWPWWLLSSASCCSLPVRATRGSDRCRRTSFTTSRSLASS